MEDNHYDFTYIENSEEVCFDYHKGKKPPKDDREWEKLNNTIWFTLKPISLALVSISEKIGLSEITIENVLEWYYRASCLFDAGEHFLFLETPEGSVPIRFTAVDFRRHIGFQGGKINLRDSEFDLKLREYRMKNIIRSGFDDV